MARGLKVVVVSADKDLLQLVTDDVVVLNPGREGSGSTRFDRKAVEEKWGVPPERIVDVLALVGDAVDNVPGVPGIGDKGARDLVREFGSVESVLEHADEVKRAAYREGLKSHREDALLSKQLVTLRTDAPVELDLEALRRQGARPGRGPRPLQGARVPGPRARVRARRDSGGGGRAPAARRLGRRSRPSWPRPGRRSGWRSASW